MLALVAAELAELPALVAACDAVAALVAASDAEPAALVAAFDAALVWV